MKIDILTLFPEMFTGPFSESILKRAQKKGLVEINLHNLRKWTKDKRGTVDDRPYGGGVGMVMMAEPIFEALKELKLKIKNEKLKTTNKNEKIILLSPRGKVWDQKKARQYSKLKELTLICGHYEGVDERIKKFIDEEISVGDYVLTGGEIPAMILVDSIVRLVPGVLEKPEATIYESFSPAVSDQGLVIRGRSSATSDREPGICRNGKRVCRSPITDHQSPITLEYPQYTRPENFQGSKVPKILLSGDHKKIEDWRRKKSTELTKKIRPELLNTKAFGK